MEEKKGGRKGARERGGARKLSILPDLFESEDGLCSGHESGAEGNAGSRLQLVSCQHPHLQKGREEEKRGKEVELWGREGSEGWKEGGKRVEEGRRKEREIPDRIRI